MCGSPNRNGHIQAHLAYLCEILGTLVFVNFPRLAEKGLEPLSLWGMNPICFHYTTPLKIVYNIQDTKKTELLKYENNLI